MAAFLKGAFLHVRLAACLRQTASRATLVGLAWSLCESRGSMASAEIELRGHIIDSYILPRIWGAIEDAGAHFRVQTMRIGTNENESSYARMEVVADTP